MNNTAYSTAQQVEDAMKVVASFISKNDKVKIQWNNENIVTANPETGIINIPRMGEVSQETLMKLRTFIYHEGGHILDTKLEKSETPKGVLFMILNALEDRRMENALKKQYAGCELVFNWAIDYYNADIAEKIQGGKVKEEKAALWEALCGMGFMVEGRTPKWQFTKTAQKYVDATYETFSKIRFAKNTKDALVIAKEIYEILKDMLKEQQKQNEQQQGNGKSKKNQKSQNEKSEKQESGNGSSESGSDGEEESEESEGSGKSGSDGEESEENAEGNSSDDSENDSEGSDSEGEEEGNKSNKGKSNSSKSEESDEDAENSSECDSDEVNEEGEYVPQNKNTKSNGSDKNQNLDEEVERMLEKQLSDGKSLSRILSDEIKQALDAIPSDEKEYIANKENDKFVVPHTNDDDKTLYKERRDSIAAAIMNMSRALEQALRSLARVKKNPYLEYGKVDMRRLVAISKSMTKKVFFNNKKGEALNTVVGIIIDESGSMSNYLDVQLLAIAICETLTKIGVPFEVYGASTVHGGWSSMPKLDGFNRTNPILYKIYKTFNETWTAVKERINHTQALKHNVDGEVVQFTANRLMNRKEKRKIVFSLSDGRPCGGHGNEEELGQHLKNVCKKCRKNGVEVVGFGIGTREPEAYYGKDNFVFLEDTKDMGGQTFFKALAEIISSGKVKV